VIAAALMTQLFPRRRDENRIDARKIADFGIGTYIRGLLHELAVVGGGYVAFAPERSRIFRRESST
jgi:hypothetical protein